MERLTSWGWHILQLALIGAVMWANQHWEITPNRYLAGIAGTVVAWLATLMAVSIIDWRTRRCAPPLLH